ncbi:hypothetical protein [Halobellus inordinatus]|uniref:hypothetical protein n=1 Tax=Halobellus inordinatus TaxID=1126236 RepID=UPI0021158C1A|nr:hypothetical protein [Halobellus ramosii]
MGVIIDEKAIARTYSHPSVADPYEIVKQYREVMRYGPDASSTRVARELSLPRGRVRPWLNGSKPDAVYAIELASKLGWLDEGWTETTEGLSQLVAGIFVCGSVQEAAMSPSWTPATAIGRSRLEAALKSAGVGIRVEDDERAEEFWPGTHPSMLGRAMVAAGAPLGEKTADSVTALPDWLDSALLSVRTGFVELLVAERAIEYPNKATRRIQTSRSASYYREVAELIQSVTGETVTYSNSGVTVSADAVRALGL